MRFVHFVPMFAFLSVVSLAAAQPAAGQSDASPYERAVHRYIHAATKEMHAYHSRIDADAAKAHGALKRRYQTVRGRLHKCETALKELKQAGRTSFDKAKAAYEQARARMLKAWHAVQDTSSG